ncbi:MAG: hypothetical protein HOW97_42980 [Catenulispora sp.]|nr:hypothetical protein [Catenulispora sp.]
MTATASNTAAGDTATATATTQAIDVAAFIRILNHAERASADEDWPLAAELWEQTVARNPLCGAYWDSLAKARSSAGDHRGAIHAYTEAAKLGVWAETETMFPAEIAFQIAVCHVRLGEPAEALTALTRAKDLGLRDRSRIRGHEALAPLRDHPTFREICGITEAASREQRWQQDLRFLIQEAARHSPIWHECAEQFTAGAEDLIRTAADLTDVQLVAGIQRLLCLLKDGHARITFTTGPLEGDRTLPIAFTDFPEGLAVTAAAPGHEHLLGAVVTAFDGRPVGELAAAVEPLVCRDNDYFLKSDVPRWLRRIPILHALGIVRRPDAVTLTVERPDGTTADLDLKTLPGPSPRPHAWARRPEEWTALSESLDTPLPLAFQGFGRSYWFEHLPDHDLIYLQFNSIKDDPGETIAEFADRLLADIAAHDVQRLVVDLRWNGGGDTLLAERLVQRIIGCERVNRPGHLFVVTGRDTFSAAQNTATLLGRHADTVFVGEPSGSRPNFIGETIPFRLPHSGLEVNIADLSWQTSYPFDHRTWIPPLLLTPPTLASALANRDPAMEAILAWTDELDGLTGRLR